MVYGAHVVDDTQPGPVALRMAAQLSSSSSSSSTVESILLVVHNLSLAALVVSQNADANATATVGTKAAAESLLRAYGRDFGNQWMAPISDLVVEQPESVAKAIAQLAPGQNFASAVVDLMDHLESEDDKDDGGWLFPNQTAVSELIARTT
jgi:type VI protein secretion system component VasK